MIKKNFSSRKSRKIFILTVLGVITAFYCWLVFAATSLPLPSLQEPILFYSNHCRHDLRLLYKEALKKASSSIYLTMYSVTDPQLLNLLKQKADNGLETIILYDPSATSKLENKLGKNAYAYPIRLEGGLMHRKILVLDDKISFLGTANFTTQSLKMHDNLVVGIFNPELARFLKSCHTSSFDFSTDAQDAELWLLPDRTGAALNQLLKIIKEAKKSIYIAMFTLTHPVIIQSLIDAHRRNVDVKIAVDHYTAQGASFKAIETCRREGIPVLLSRGQQLFHHKWAIIDYSKFIVGSTNWTKTAFTKNQDCFIIFHKISSKQKKTVKKIWKLIELESA